MDVLTARRLVFLQIPLLRIYPPNNRHTWATIKQIAKPITTGRSVEIAVHFLLLVSL